MSKANKNNLGSKVELLKEKLNEEQTKNSITTAILEGGTLIIWAVDSNLKLVSFNQNYFNYFLDSSPEKELLYETNGSIYKTNAKSFWERKYEKALRGESVSFEIGLTIDEEEYWKEVFLNPIYQSSGEIDGISGLAYDITEKMNSRIEMIHSERKFRNIFESFQDLYFRCDFSGHIIMLSPSVTDIIGYLEENLLGKNITNYYLYKAKTKSLIRTLAKNRRIRNIEIDLIHKSGKIIPCICNVRFIYDDNNKPIFIEGVARDITELKETNEQLMVAKELAEESLKVKERFLANMSHEIRTPLNGIIGMIHLLDKPNLDGKQKKHLSALKSSSKLLLDILNDLLDISKIEAGKMVLKYQPVSVDDMLNKLKLLYKEQAKVNHINLKIKKDPNVPAYIFTDETKIIQIYSNLISNAIKFTRKGGKIIISLAVKKKQINGWVELAGKVKDNGIGMSEQDKNQIFESFTQLDSSSKKAFKGTGLGLYITRHLVGLFNGKIDVKSTPNKGSTFSFTFESSTTRIRPKQAQDEDKKDLKGMPSVLIVDDNEINLELASTILLNSGCKVDQVNSGEKALDHVKTANYSLILMDIQMPDMDGIMATKKIRSSLNDKTPPIIAMTAYSMSGDEDKFLQMGFDDYIAKPIKPDLLISKVEKWAGELVNNASYTKKSRTKINLPSINLAVLKKLEAFGGEEMVKTALVEFKQECENQLKACDLAFKEKNFEEVLIILHTLKGNAGTLGIEKMATQAGKIESEIKKEKYFTFIEQITILKKLFSRFNKDLSTLLK